MEDRQVLEQAAALRALESGRSLNGAWLRSLELSGGTLPGLSLKNTRIDAILLEDVTITGASCFDGAEFEAKAVFRRVRFEGGALFRRADFRNGAEFSGCTFGGHTHFNAARFERWVTFQGSEFKAKAIFSRARFPKGALFTEARFRAGGSFNDTVTEHRFQMQRARFEGRVTFSSAHFWEVTDFEGAVFESDARFKGTRFYKRVSFRGAHFLGDVLFNGAALMDDGGFQEAQFEGLINLQSTNGQRNMDFHGADVGAEGRFILQQAHFGRLLLSREQIDGHLASLREGDWASARREFGLLKSSFREVNEYGAEDWAYLMEKRMERATWPWRRPLSALRRVCAWLFLDLACGYGTRSLNIFATSALILGGFAAFYSTCGAHFEGGITFAQALQLSFRTFTNAEVNSAEPFVDSWVNYVIMVESFLGVFVMMVLVVTFSRKVIR